jgi:hypothetical protein
MDLNTGVVTPIATYGQQGPEGRLALSPTTGVPYLADINDSFKLKIIDPTTGAVTTVGSMGAGIRSISFNPTNGTLYGVAYDNLGTELVQPRLCTINTSTGVATAGRTLIAPDYTGPGGPNPTFFTSPTSLAFGPDGPAYLVSSSFSFGSTFNLFNNSDLSGLFTINTVTGSTALVGPPRDGERVQVRHSCHLGQPTFWLQHGLLQWSRRRPIHRRKCHSHRPCDRSGLARAPSSGIAAVRRSLRTRCRPHF